MEKVEERSSVGTTKRSVRRRRHQEQAKKRKRTKKEKRTNVNETAAGAGSSNEDGTVQPATGEGKKPGTLKLSQELMEYIRTREVMGIVATEKLHPLLECIPQELFGWDWELKEQTAAEYKENREFDAHVLFQYRTKGYAEIQYEEKRNSHDDKPKPDEVKQMVVDAGSKEEIMAQPAGEGKRKKLVTQEVVDFYVGVEIVHYMLCKPLQTPLDETVFNPLFSSSVASSKKVMEEEADMLRLYRTNKHTELPTNEQARLDNRKDLKTEPFVIHESAPKPKMDVLMQVTVIDRKCPNCRHPKLEYCQRLRGADKGILTYYRCPDCGYIFNES